MFAVVVVFCFCAVLSRGVPVDDDEISRIDLSHLGDRIYRRPSDETGKLLESWDPKSEVNPEELGEYAEGDILFPNLARNGMISQSLRWKNGVVPYEIRGSFSSSERSLIERAMGIYHKYTCIKFRPKTALDKDYISIVNGASGCWSSVGRITGRQEINLQSPYCITTVGTPLHELMHAVGFLHEQNRYERDNHVRIAWQNIKSGHSQNFDKASKSQTDGFGVPYDYKSVMHYSKTAFSINGQPTIIPTQSGADQQMGQRKGFSRGDITKINNMYGCPERTPGYKEPNLQYKPPNNNNGNNVGGILGGILSIFTGHDEDEEKS